MTDYWLSDSSHETREQGMCAMEWVAYVAGEAHTDEPICVSPVLRRFAISLNDTWPDEQRQKLRPYLARCIGTAGDDRDMERGWLAMDWLVRTFTPRFLDLVPSLAGHAEKLRALSPVMAPAALDDAMIVLGETRQASAAAWDAAGGAAGDAAWDAAWAAARGAAGDAARAAAWDAAWDAAGGAAGDAAWAAAWGAARGAAWAAAWDAARGAAWAAAWDAARGAAGDAAWDAARGAAWGAARDALSPAVTDLQASALDLFNRMLPLEPVAMPVLTDEAAALCHVAP
jgi:hypothetical protein